MNRLLLLSGGIDSAALAQWLRPQETLTVDYGQEAFRGELNAAKAIARSLRLRHRVVKVDARDLGLGSMAGKRRSVGAPTPEWWPFRNQLLITLGAMTAARRGCREVVIGTVRSDGAHRDGTKRFLSSIDRLCAAQELDIRVSAPAISLSSLDLVRRSKITRERLAWCHSCHIDSIACGKCRGCAKHLAVLSELGWL